MIAYVTPLLRKLVLTEKQVQSWVYTSSFSTQLLLSTVNSMSHITYADDTEIYLELDSMIFNSNITELANCLQ